MKHPTQEEWMDYLYNEAPANERAKLSAHLAACPECRTQVQGWQKTMTSLDTWQPAVKEAPAFRWMPAIRWATAAMIMLSFGFTLSRMTTPKVDVAAVEAQVRAQLTAEVKQQMQQSMAEFTAAQAKQRVEDQQQVVQTLRQMEAQRLADIASLRYDMESLAMSAHLLPSTGNEKLTAQISIEK
ncbi:MAG TPA: zf-HC2 domain-containing protein [Verrucomicrobiae bacterium]